MAKYFVVTEVAISVAHIVQGRVFGSKWPNSPYPDQTYRFHHARTKFFSSRLLSNVDWAGDRRRHHLFAKLTCQIHSAGHKGNLRLAGGVPAAMEDFTYEVLMEMVMPL